MAFSKYNVKEIVASFGGVVLRGFAPDSGITVEQNSEKFTRQVGSDGEVTRSASNDDTLNVKFTLSRQAACNRELMALHAGGFVGPFMLKDLNGDTLYVAEHAWIAELPSDEFSKEATGREWTIHTGAANSFIGGAV